MADILYIVVPCYNEEEVLPETSRRRRAKLEGLMAAGKISERSRVLFVNDVKYIKFLLKFQRDLIE